MGIVRVIKNGTKQVFLIVLCVLSSFTMRTRKSFATQPIPVVSLVVIPNQETKIILKSRNKTNNEKSKSIEIFESTKQFENDENDKHTDYFNVQLNIAPGQKVKAIILLKHRTKIEQDEYDQKKLNVETQELYKKLGILQPFSDLDNFVKINSVGRTLDDKTHDFCIWKKLPEGHPFRKKHINPVTGKMNAGARYIRTSVYQQKFDPITEKWIITPSRIKNFLYNTEILDTENELLQKALEENKKLVANNKHLLEKILYFRSKQT